MKAPLFLTVRLLLAGLLAGLAAAPARAQNVGIGTTAPTQTLDVNGNLRVRAAAGTGTGRLLGVGPDGTLQVQAPLFGATATGTPQAPAPLGSPAATDGYPSRVRLNPAGTRAYVLTSASTASPGRGSLQTFDITGPTPVPVGSPVPTVTDADYLELSQAGTRAWVLGAYSNGGLQGFDLSQGQPVALGPAVPSGADNLALAVNPAGTRAFVCTYGLGLLAFDLTQGGAPTVVTQSVYYSDLAVSPDGTRLFATSDDVVTTYDISTGQPVVLNVLSGVGSYLQYMVVSPDGTRLYVLDERLGQTPAVVRTFDISSGRPVAVGTPVSTGGIFASGLTISANGNVLAVMNYIGLTMQVYDKSSSGQLVPRPLVPMAGGRPALSPDGSRAYLLQNDQTLHTYLLAAPRVLAVGSDGSLGSLDPAQLGDNLGNHLATRNLNLGPNQLVGNGSSTGLSITASGSTSLGTGQLVGNGSSTGLSITAAGHTNLGTGQLVGNGGSQGLAISQAGSVGVGTTRPGAPLEVQAGPALTSSTVGTAPLLRLSRPGTSGDKWPGAAELAVGTYATGISSLSRLDFRLGQNGNDAVDQTVLTLRGDGRAGFGTAEPASLLANTAQNIIGSDQFGVGGRSLTWMNDGQGYAAAVGNTAAGLGGNGLAVKVADNSANTAALDVSQGTSPAAGAPLLRVRADGNVGVGTSAPSARLDVAGSTRLRGLTAGVVVADASGNLSSTAASALADNLGNHTATQNLSLGTFQLVGNGGSTGLSIGSTGRVGIGTGGMAPRGALDVAATGDSYLVADPNNGSTQSLYLPGHLYLAPYSGTSGTAYVQARVPNATSSTGIGLTLRTTNAGALVDALTLGADGTATLAGPLTVPTLNATTVNATTVNATTVAATSVTTAATGTANMLAAAYGNVFGAGTLANASANATVGRTGNVGEYLLTFTGPLATADFSTRAVALTLFNGPGFISYSSGGAAGRLLVRTYNPAGTLTDRGFSFVIFQP